MYEHDLKSQRTQNIQGVAALTHLANQANQASASHPRDCAELAQEIHTLQDRISNLEQLGAVLAQRLEPVCRMTPTAIGKGIPEVGGLSAVGADIRSCSDRIAMLEVRLSQVMESLAV